MNQLPAELLLSLLLSTHQVTTASRDISRSTHIVYNVLVVGSECTCTSIQHYYVAIRKRVDFKQCFLLHVNQYAAEKQALSIDQIDYSGIF